MGFVKRLERDERGVVESSLVMIPLILLFLITMELVAAVNFRNVDASLAQNDASIHAITGSFSSHDEVVTLAIRNSKKRLRMVISHRSRPLFGIASHLSPVSNRGYFSTDAVGIAVVEENP